MTIEIIPIPGLPEVKAGDDLAGLIAGAARAAGVALRDGDILVVTQKVVSKAEGRSVDLRSVEPSPLARHIAQRGQKDARQVEVVLRESTRIVRMDISRGVIIAETRHGFVCANAGVDASNVPGETMVTLLPVDPDASARQIRDGLRRRTRADVAVVISDTFGRPWRDGLVDVAIGVAGMEALLDLRGRRDTEGKLLKATAIAVADELCSAANLVMGRMDRVPVAVVRGYTYQRAEGSAKRLIRPAHDDLFRY
jgi:coenzyme F420-0:L-glutamate ligase/coenzyme F420-1:gamma-L-glutamate ligase